MIIPFEQQPKSIKINGYAYIVCTESKRKE